MQPHRVQQPKHVTTPTRSIQNAHNGYIPPDIPDTQWSSFQLYSQMSSYAQSSVYFVTVVIIAIILLFYASSIALAILQLKKNMDKIHHFKKT